jgi:predicted secreted protein
MSIVAFAEREFAKKDYDRAYCVFDRDEHDNYFDALHRITTLPKFYAVPSWPCFEIWILLHFKYSTAPRNRHEAFDEVKKCYPAYTKGCKTVFDDLAHSLENALQNAQRLHGENTKNGSVNPATKMHELVNYLIGLKG